MKILSKIISEVGVPFATLSFKSTIIRCAVFAPIPFTACTATTSADLI